MNVSAISAMNFGKLYRNPNGSVVNVSDTAIKDAETTRDIALAVRSTIKKGEIDVGKKTVKDAAGTEKLFFTISKDGKCYVTTDPANIAKKRLQKGSKVKFVGETTLVEDISAHDIETGKYYSCEKNGIRAGASYKYAHFTQDGKICITCPEWAP